MHLYAQKLKTNYFILLKRKTCLPQIKKIIVVIKFGFEADVDKL